MNEAQIIEVQERAERARACLARAVADALEHKRRLGQYAVIYRDGKPVRILPDGPRTTPEQ